MRNANRRFVLKARPEGIAGPEHFTEDAVAVRSGQPRQLRIGINLGDVIVEGEDLDGDAVNIAARVEALADAGGVFVSKTVHDQVRDRLPLVFEDLAEQPVKNITRPVRVYRVRDAWRSPGFQGHRCGGVHSKLLRWKKSAFRCRPVGIVIGNRLRWSQLLFGQAARPSQTHVRIKPSSSVRAKSIAWSIDLPCCVHWATSLQMVPCANICVPRLVGAG
jgi:hypothetical protein